MLPRLALLLALSLAPPIAANGGVLDGWAVGETHRLKPGVFHHALRKAPAAAGAAVGVLPVALDRELAASFEYGDRGAGFAPIVAFVQARLAADPGLRALDAATLPATGLPRVFVGSAAGDLAPPDAMQSRSPLDVFPPMVLFVERPTRAWRAAARDSLSAAGLTQLLVIRVSVSQYPKQQRGFTRKAVLLGTGHEAPVKFLTAVDKPLEVLQVSGLLVDADGRVLRAGAEGVLYRDTPFLAQTFDITRMLDDEALAAALDSERRQDLPGAPLALEVAVDNLVAQLLQDPRRLRVPLP